MLACNQTIKENSIHEKLITNLVKIYNASTSVDPCVQNKAEKNL